MRFGLTAKLFLAVLATSVATAIAVGLGVRAVFDQGFERYVEEREDERRARLAAVFAAAYKEHGSWDFLRGDEALWIELNHRVRPSPRSVGGGLALARPVPPPEHVPGEGRGFGRSMRPPPGQLRDQQGGIVVGDAVLGGPILERAVVVDGVRVGTLAHPKRQTAFDVVDRRFKEHIGEAVLLLGLGTITLSAFAAWFLARHLLAPVRRIAAATRALADGRYATRVEPSSTDEVGRLADDFNRLGNSLEKNEASRRQFMADISHELRTPLAVLKGELEAIEDGVRAPDREAMASLQVEVARLGKLVDDLHDLSLADVGGVAFRFEPVDLATLVREAFDHAAGRISAAGLTSTVSGGEPPVEVHGDPQRLAQLVGNLLENSLRYTDAGGRVQVSIARDDSRALLAWEDSAPGVPPEALPRLFERLYRVDESRSRAAGGSGLGLAIARSIVEAHGGRIEARASALGGLRIEVHLPLAQPA